MKRNEDVGAIDPLGALSDALDQFQPRLFDNFEHLLLMAEHIQHAALGAPQEIDYMVVGRLTETASRHGAHIINLSLGTSNMGKALLLRDCCSLAVEQGSVVLAAAHPLAKRAYPADLPETVGTASHRDCPLDKFYYFAPETFPRKDWGNLSGRFLAHGFGVPTAPRTPVPFRGPTIATATLSGHAACLRQALGDVGANRIIDTLRELALTPDPAGGYA